MLARVCGVTVEIPAFSYLMSNSQEDSVWWVV